MLLQPKFFKSKKNQKNRICKKFKTNKILKFGTTGLLLLKPLQLTSKNIFKLKLFLKKSSRKSDKTFRKYWLFIFPHLPLSKKPIGTRMGKGKGKLELWYTNCQGGNIFIELKNLRLGRSIFFFNQIRYRFGLPMKIIYKSNFFLKLPIKNSIIKIKNFD